MLLRVGHNVYNRGQDRGARGPVSFNMRIQATDSKSVRALRLSSDNMSYCGAAVGGLPHLRKFLLNNHRPLRPVLCLRSQRKPFSKMLKRSAGIIRCAAQSLENAPAPSVRLGPSAVDFNDDVEHNHDRTIHAYAEPESLSWILKPHSSVDSRMRPPSLSIPDEPMLELLSLST